MPKDVTYGGKKPESETQKQAKGKNGSSLSNDLFASVENFLYEFGFISRPPSQKGKTGAGRDEEHYQKQGEPGEDDSYDYSEDEVLLSQYNRIGQQYWHGPESDLSQAELGNPGEDDSYDYSQDEVLLSQYNKIGQQYWHGLESDPGEAEH